MIDRQAAVASAFTVAGSIFIFWYVFSNISQPDPMEVKYKAVLIANNELTTQLIGLQAVKNFIDNAGVTIIWNGCEDLKAEVDAAQKDGGPIPSLN